MKWQACPICHGRMVVPAGFYTGVASGTAPETCRTCKGLGVIQEPTTTALTTTVSTGSVSLSNVTQFKDDDNISWTLGGRC